MELKKLWIGGIEWPFLATVGKIVRNFGLSHIGGGV